MLGYGSTEATLGIKMIILPAVVVLIWLFNMYKTGGFRK